MTWLAGAFLAVAAWSTTTVHGFVVPTSSIYCHGNVVPPLASATTPDDTTSKTPNTITLEMEQQVLAAAQEQLDRNAVVQALSRNPQEAPTTSNQFQIAVAAASVTALAVWTWWGHVVWITSLVFGVVLQQAWQDPVEDDSVGGAVARLVGRQTLKVQPKVQAVARALVTGQDELVTLQKEIQQLQHDIAQLQPDRQGNGWPLDSQSDVFGSSMVTPPSVHTSAKRKRLSTAEFVKGRRSLAENSQNYPLRSRDEQRRRRYNPQADGRLYHVVEEEIKYGEKALPSRTQATTGGVSTYPAQEDASSSTLQISTAGAAAAALLSFGAFSNLSLSLLCFGVVWVMAMTSSPQEPDPTTALVHALGETTLDVAKPKLQAMMRALVVQEEEIAALERQRQQLQTLHSKLLQQKEHQTATPNTIPPLGSSVAVPKSLEMSKSPTPVPPPELPVTTKETMNIQSTKLPVRSQASPSSTKVLAMDLPTTPVPFTMKVDPISSSAATVPPLDIQPAPMPSSTETAQQVSQNFTHDVLQQMAYRHGLSTYGSKTDLVTRLLEARVIDCNN